GQVNFGGEVGLLRFEEPMDVLQDGSTRVMISRARSTRAIELQAQNGWIAWISLEAESVSFRPGVGHTGRYPEFSEVICLDPRNAQVVGDLSVEAFSSKRQERDRICHRLAGNVIAKR